MSSFWSNSNFFFNNSTNCKHISKRFTMIQMSNMYRISTAFEALLVFSSESVSLDWILIHGSFASFELKRHCFGKKTYENSIPKICSIFFCVQVQQRFWHIQIHSMETLPKCVCLNSSHNSRKMMHVITNVSNAPKYVQWTLSINNGSMCPKWLNLAAFLPTEQKLGH